MLTINLFNGLVYGALLIVMCSGLALIYGLRRVVNFAHGSLYMLGAYLGYTVALQSNFWVALVVAPALMAVFGVLLDRYGFRLLQDREPHRRAGHLRLAARHRRHGAVGVGQK
jgi:branched-chain amino acid transport system permease protein